MAKEEKIKKAKKAKEVTVVAVKHNKAVPEKEINPATGSRFAPGTSSQIALELIVAGVEKGQSAKDIRKALAEYRKENGKDRNLDAGYFPFAVATHPEFFEVKSDGTVTLKKEFEPDPEALAKLKNKTEKRKAKKEERDPKKKLKAKGGKPVLAK